MSNRISSRQYQILELLLKTKIGLSIDEIATALNISRNAVQQHFSSLEKDKLIQTGEQKKTAGRPVRTFVLTEAGINCFPKQYAWFSDLILSDLKHELGEPAFKKHLQKLGLSLAQSLLPQFNETSTTQRIDQLINVMEGLGYQASSRQDPENNHYIEACNCIYHDLAQKHEEICELDKTLISTLLDKQIEQVECMAQGGNICSFKIKP